MFKIRCYSSLDSFHASFDGNVAKKDFKPDKIVLKDNQKSAEYLAVQLSNKYEIVDVWNDEDFSCFCIWAAK